MPDIEAEDAEKPDAKPAADVGGASAQPWVAPDEEQPATGPADSPAPPAEGNATSPNSAVAALRAKAAQALASPAGGDAPGGDAPGSARRGRRRGAATGRNASAEPEAPEQAEVLAGAPGGVLDRLKCGGSRKEGAAEEGAEAAGVLERLRCGGARRAAADGAGGAAADGAADGTGGAAEEGAEAAGVLARLRCGGLGRKGGAGESSGNGTLQGSQALPPPPRPPSC